MFCAVDVPSAGGELSAYLAEAGFSTGTDGCVRRWRIKSNMEKNAHPPREQPPRRRASLGDVIEKAWLAEHSSPLKSPRGLYSPRRGSLPTSSLPPLATEGRRQVSVDPPERHGLGRPISNREPMPERDDPVEPSPRRSGLPPRQPSQGSPEAGERRLLVASSPPRENSRMFPPKPPTSKPAHQPTPRGRRPSFMEVFESAVSKHEEAQQKQREAEAAAVAGKVSQWSKLRLAMVFLSKVRASLAEKAEAQANEPPIAAPAAEAPPAAVASPRQQPRRWQAAAQRATEIPAAAAAPVVAPAAAAAPAAATPRAPNHKVLEVQQLFAVFEAGRTRSRTRSGSLESERRTQGGQGGQGGAPSLSSMVVRSGGDGSFASVLHMVYPQASARDVRRMCSWVAPKKEEAKERTLTAEQRATVKTLFAGFDADASGTLELSELEEAGWGQDGTAELVEIFNRHDADGSGCLNLEQFTLFCQECSMFDDGLLEDAAKKAVADRQARIKKTAAEGAKRGGASQQRRPSLADLAQGRRY